MNFVSDNAGPMHPHVLEALTRANDGYQMPYGSDTLMEGVTEGLREVFEAPDAAVYLVPTGTAANALALATYSRPWDAIFCHRTAHVEEDECGAPEFYANGAKLLPLDGEDGKISPDTLRDAIEITGDRGVHGVQRGPVTLTQATEVGTVYTLDEIKALSNIAQSYGLKTHLDGARFSNAAVSLGCSAAEMTWKAGIDAVSFGGTKNGCAAVEAVILFDPEKAWEFELRRKRGAHLFSKHRFLSAQMQAYIQNDLWLDSARKANTACTRLAEGIRAIKGCKLLYAPQANIIFAQLPRRAHQRAMNAGAQYYLLPFETSLGGPPDELLTCRLVCDWSKTDAEVDQLIELMRG